MLICVGRPWKPLHSIQAPLASPIETVRHFHTCSRRRPTTMTQAPPRRSYLRAMRCLPSWRPIPAALLRSRVRGGHTQRRYTPTRAMPGTGACSIPDNAIHVPDCVHRLRCRRKGGLIINQEDEPCVDCLSVEAPLRSGRQLASSDTYKA